MTDAFRIELDDAALNASMDRITKAAAKAVRPAAQAGAEEYYFEARLRCPVSAEAHYFYGRQSKKTGVRYLFEPGNLRNSLYQVYSKDNSGQGLAEYHVAWNHQKAPYGFMVEYGTSRAPAHPFLRPAYAAVQQHALQVANAVLLDEMRKELA